MANTNLTRYNPFSEMVSLREAMDRLFEDSFISPRNVGQWGGRGVAANLFETPEGFILQLPMPGVNAEEVEITAQQDILTLKWQTRLIQDDLFGHPVFLKCLPHDAVNRGAKIPPLAPPSINLCTIDILYLL